MTSEYLLDAIGRLDDDLIREAENYRRPKARRGLWMGLAASFAVVIALGYVLTHVGGMGGGAAPGLSGGGNGGAPASGSSAPSEAQGGNSGGVFDQEAPLGGSEPSAPSGENAEAPSNSGGYGDASPDLRDQLLSISVWMGGPVNRFWYTFFHYYNDDRILNELPEGCVELGPLESLSVTEEPNVPYTDSEEYVGCPVWLLQTDPFPKKFKLYVELPEGGYLECR